MKGSIRDNYLEQELSKVFNSLEFGKDWWKRSSQG